MLEMIYLKHLEKLSESCHGHTSILTQDVYIFSPPSTTLSETPSHLKNQNLPAKSKQGKAVLFSTLIFSQKNWKIWGRRKKGEDLVLCTLASQPGSSNNHQQPLPTCHTLAPWGRALLRMTTLFLSLPTAQFPTCTDEQGIHIYKEKGNNYSYQLNLKYP